MPIMQGPQLLYNTVQYNANTITPSYEPAANTHSAMLFKFHWVITERTVSWDMMCSSEMGTSVSKEANASIFWVQELTNYKYYTPEDTRHSLWQNPQVSQGGTLSYPIVYKSTGHDYSMLLVGNPHTHIMVLFILEDGGIDPALPQHLAQTLNHSITHYSELACWNWFSMRRWCHLYHRVLQHVSESVSTSIIRVQCEEWWGHRM